VSNWTINNRAMDVHLVYAGSAEAADPKGGRLRKTRENVTWLLDVPVLLTQHLSNSWMLRTPERGVMERHLIVIAIGILVHSSLEDC
jgi:hypothetical protein